MIANNKEKVLFQKTSEDQQPENFIVFNLYPDAVYRNSELESDPNHNVVIHEKRRIYDDDYPPIRIIVPRNMTQEYMTHLYNFMNFFENKMDWNWKRMCDRGIYTARR